MKLTKKILSKEISNQLDINLKISSQITNSFINLIKKNSLNKSVKISKFGTFSIHQTPEREGRNPKTKESYIIKSFKKVKFTPSCKIKKILN